MDQLTTYTIKSKADGFVWQFKYHLNGVLAEFKVMDAILTEKQMVWLAEHFPFREEWIKEWQVKLQKNFEITIGEPVLTFDTLWELYGNKVKKHQAEQSFKKLKPAEIIKCFLHIPKYKKRLARTREAQAHLSTYINQRYFEDEE